MQQMKKRVFIGSSTEAVEDAHRIKRHIEDQSKNSEVKYECVVWKEIFPDGTVFGNLLNAPDDFDYAIFVAAPDDTVKKNSDGTEKQAPRDNIYFEIGLFMGKLGADCVQIVKHKKCQIATDIKDFIFHEYEDLRDETFARGLCYTIKNNMDKESKNEKRTHRSTDQVNGYFENFLKKLSKILSDSNAAVFDETGKQYSLKNVKSRRIVVVNPDIAELGNNFNSWHEVFRQEHHLPEKDLHIQGNGDSARVAIPKSFFDEFDKSNKDSIEFTIYDVPTTLKTVMTTAIDSRPSNTVGLDDNQKYRIEKEIQVFFRALERKIEEDALVRKYTCIKDSGDIPQT